MDKFKNYFSNKQIDIGATKEEKVILVKYTDSEVYFEVINKSKETNKDETNIKYEKLNEESGK